MAIFLSILVAILWACFDAIRKQSIQFISEINALFLIVIAQFFLFLFFLSFSDFQIDIYSYYIYGIFLIFLNLISMYMFLKVLKKYPEKMPKVFSDMFKTSSSTIIKFLSNKSNIFEDIIIISKMPKLIFLRALFD